MSIPEETIERIKREIPIRALVESYGVKLTGGSDNLKGLCLFHSETTPSLVVSPAKSLWHCFGACQAGGSVIDWVMKAKSVDFRRAVELLEKRLPSLAVPQATPSPKAVKTEPSVEPDGAMLRRVVAFYHRTLIDGGAEGLGYLEARGLYSSELIQAFQIGLANRSLGNSLPDKSTPAGSAVRSQLQRFGVLRATGHEHFRGSLVIPVFGEDGDVLEIYGRKIRRDLPDASSKHLYLPRRADGRRGVFNLPGVKSSSEVILTEALIDALTFWNAGFRNVTSAYGVEGFTEEMLDAMLRAGVRRVLIAYDRDEAGDKAAAKLALELAHRGLEVFRIQFPKGMDANEYAQKVKPAEKSLDAAIRGAQWIAGLRPVPVADAPLVEPPHDPITGEALPTPPPSATTTEKKTPPLVAPAIAPPAAPMPVVADSAGIVFEKNDAGEIRCRLGDRQWRLRGLRTDVAPSTLRINVLVAKESLFYVETFDLYNSRQRPAFVKQAAEELQIEEAAIKADLGKILMQIEKHLDEDRRAAEAAKVRAPMTEEERAEALALLRDPKLLDRILADFDKSGVVGEEANKLVAYLAAVSRKLEAPLAVVVQSSSAAGKSSLMDAVLRFVPQEDRVQFSAMTGQSLYYMGENDLRNKILAIAEEEGAQSASYALKLLQSEGQLSIASPSKDPATGKIVTIPYSVQGPVAIFMTTTAIEVDEELLNRCLVLTVDEGADQTAAIHRRQRNAQTLEGLLHKRSRDRVQTLHQNAQRLLEPLLVANPFAPKLSFDHRRTRARRDHVKYLTLIRASAFLHQHQRPVRTVDHGDEVLRYIEATEEDLGIADRLARILFGGNDELPEQTRRLLTAIDGLARARARETGTDVASVRITRREIREATGGSNAVLKKHLARLEDLEYLKAHGAGRGRAALYELTALPLAAETSASWLPGNHELTPRKPELAPHWLPPGSPPGESSYPPEVPEGSIASDQVGSPFGGALIRAKSEIGPKARLNGHAAPGK